jgi:hypothetical protein
MNDLNRKSAEAPRNSLSHPLNISEIDKTRLMLSSMSPSLILGCPGKKVRLRVNSPRRPSVNRDLETDFAR